MRIFKLEYSTWHAALNRGELDGEICETVPLRALSQRDGRVASGDLHVEFLFNED